MQIILSDSLRVPIYEQVRRQVIQQIVTGQLKPGDAIPSIRTLAKDLKVSVITTRRAYEELEREGFIQSMVGRGSYVAPQEPGTLKARSMQLVEEQIGEAVKFSASLGVTLEELIALVRRLHKED